MAAAYGGERLFNNVAKLALVARYAVHPKADDIEGVPAYRSVDDLPVAPDAAFIGVNRDATITVVRQLAEKGAGGLSVLPLVF